MNFIIIFHNNYADAHLTAKDITCMGISTQRSTFITWDRKSGETFHNFVTWKDLRADAMVRKWNSSLTLKVPFDKLILLPYIGKVCEG